MEKIQNKKQYDLEKRTFEFAREVRAFIKVLPKNMVNMEDCKQLLRSSGSVGANYIEANESLSKKDFSHRIKICRKEAKESIYWLNLIEADVKSKESKEKLVQESTELMMIFSAIMRKSV